MTTTTKPAEIQAKLDAATNALNDNHRRLYEEVLTNALTGKNNPMRLQDLPRPVIEALCLCVDLKWAIDASNEAEEKQRQESPLVATATEILTALIAANPDTDAKYLAADALAAARKLHDREG
jgi:hypothetical protein